MKSMAILGLTMVLGGSGCASTNAGARTPELGGAAAGWQNPSSLRVGQAQVMATRVNPLAPVGVASQGGAVALSYGQSSGSRAFARVDAESLRPVSASEGVTSPQADDASGASIGAGAAPARVTLEGGHVVLVSKQGDAEWGYRAFAQEFDVDGTPVGAPVAISPPDVDVMGSPGAVTTDGRHVIATFTGSSENGFELVAVPIEVGPVAGGERVARK